MQGRISLLLMLVATSSVQRNDSAIDQLQRIQAMLRKSHDANDWRSNLTAANEQKKFLNEAPNSLLEVARADVHLGNFEAAFHELEQFTRMGQSTSLFTTAPDFAPLLKQANFATIQQRMQTSRSRISLGSTIFLVPNSTLLSEDVDYDPGTKRLLITSVREKKIISIDAKGTIADFATAPDGWPILADKVDARRHLLWATEVAIRGFTLAPESDWGRSAVLCFDLTNGELMRRIEGPRETALGDMVLTPKGDVIVTDGSGGGVYRLSASGTALERLDGGDFISPQTPAMHPDGAHIFVPDYVRGIGLMELATKQVRWLPMSGRFALNGIDGLYFNRGKLLAVQNGTSPERVVAFTLDASLTRIEAEKIIERSTDTLGDPTHGTIVGNEFWYIANSGWENTDDGGNLKSAAGSSPPRIMRVNVKNLSSFETESRATARDEPR